MRCQLPFSLIGMMVVINAALPFFGILVRKKAAVETIKTVDATHKNTNSLWKSESKRIGHQKRPHEVFTEQNKTVKPAAYVSTNKLNSTTTEKITSPYAYVFVVGGCDPDDGLYRNYLYNILNSAKVLKEFGSEADVVAFFQMKYNSKSDTLPSNEVRWLKTLNIKIKYIPKSRHESFYLITLNKFRILGLTEYHRVLFLDADILPLNNLDYVFKTSVSNAKEHQWVQPNLVYAGAMEPANGGFFMFEPAENALAEVEGIIKKRSENGQKNKNAHKGWDPAVGWGHTIAAPNDFWESNRKKGHDWTFHAAFGMQGLLYYYAKYVRQNVTLVLANRAQKWQTGPGGEPLMVEEIVNPFAKDSPIPPYAMTIKAMQCSKWTRGKGCPPPYRDFMHFSGQEKPWVAGPPRDLHRDGISTPQRLWWKTLVGLNEELQMGIDEDLKSWKSGRKSPLGFTPSKGHARDTTINFVEAEKK